ncbi:MAG: diguanylate cyclase [Clostridiales bacterium]|nr:diguanylate cyclase [Clostridiales bacterium]
MNYNLWWGIGATVLCIVFLLLIFIILIKNNILKQEKRKLAIVNAELEEKEYLFRTIFEQSPIGICFGNYTDNIMDANPMYEKIIGRPLKDLDSLSWREYTHPDDVEKDIALANKLKDKEIDGYTMVKRYVRPDNSIAWVNMTIAPLHLKNKANHICIIDDITEQVEAEKALQESNRQNNMLLSNLPGMAYRCNFDKDWTMQFVSEGCYSLTEYPPESLINNKDLSFNDLIQPEFRENLWRKWEETLEKHEVFKGEYKINTASGEEKWVLEQGRGVYDGNNKLIAIEGLIIDISDQKKREDEISYLNYHDVLTGLYNRRYIDEIVEKYDQKQYYPLSIVVGDINGLKLINDTLGHLEGDRIITTMARILSSCCREQDIIARTGGDEFNIILPNTDYEETENIIKQIQKTCGECTEIAKEDIYYISISLGCATKTEEKESIMAIMKDAEDNMYRDKLLHNRSLHSSVLSSMKSTLFAKSQETQEHAQRLIKLSKAIGQQMHLTEKELNELEILSSLHDIGKIGISDTLLNKPGKLTDEEWIEMRKHSEIGYRIAMSIPGLAPIAEYILSHHERYDGKGYPQGLQGDDIPTLSRILSIVDAYDAMTSDRPYKSAMTKATAIEEIKNCAGTQFDPVIVDIFLKII